MAKQPPLTVEIIGTEEAARYLHGVVVQSVQNVARAMEQSSLFMEGEVKQSIAGQRAEPRSVDTGNFMNKTKGVWEPDKVVVYTNVEYAPYLEAGTTKMVPRRHFYNSMARNKNKVLRYIQKAIQDSTRARII